jgi:DNA polymerase III alpha subunit
MNKDLQKFADSKDSIKKDLDSLIKFVRNEKITKRTIESLCKLQYFKEFYDNSAALEYILLNIRNLNKKKFEDKEIIDEIIRKGNNKKDYTKKDVLKFQKEFFNFYIDEHPFAEKFEIIKNSIPEVLENVFTPTTCKESNENKYLIIGIVNDIIMKKSKKTKREYYKLIIEDEKNQVIITVWNASDISKLSKGDFILMKISKNKFGFTKLKDSEIDIF